MLHPFPGHVSTLGEVYFARVDPVFRVLYRPAGKALLAAAAVGESLGGNGRLQEKGKEALLFAMYFAAVTSLTDEDCSQLFQQERMKLAAQFKSGLESAMTQADLLNTVDLTLLQAFVLYLVRRLSLQLPDACRYLSDH